MSLGVFVVVVLIWHHQNSYAAWLTERLITMKPSDALSLVGKFWLPNML